MGIDGSMYIELIANKDFNVQAYPFLEGIVQRATSHNSYLPHEKQPFAYYIKSASIVAVLDGFEQCGYRLVNQTVDQNFILSTMHHI